jgi:transcriptional regulator of acetoin/glycerol metabolism
MTRNNRNGKLSDVDVAVKSIIEKALNETGWQIHKAALLIKMNPPTFYRLARKFKLIKEVTVTRTVRKLVKA